MQSRTPSQPAKSILKSYFVTDRKALAGGDLISTIGRAIEAGVDMIQIREKDLPGRDLERITRGAVEMAEGSRTEILVNDRLDVALAAGAAGVHLPAAGLPVGAVKRVIRTRGRASDGDFPLLVGVSTHSREEAQEAAKAGVDFLVFGPVFQTASKPGHPGMGIDALAEVVRAVDVPVFAIGGVSPERVDRLARTGVAGVAGISVFLREDSRRDLLSQLKKSSKLGRRETV
jgi:thiamine-phosphate pyrophosphorylase